MNDHKEYGEGFVDGFNAALKSDYIKELYQTRDKERYINRIKELEAQLDKINAAISGIYNTYQMCGIQQNILQQQAHSSLFDINGMMNAYGRH